MRLRRSYDVGPRWVRVVVPLLVAAVTAGLAVAYVNPTWKAVLIAGMAVALATSIAFGEQRYRRRLARNIGWDGEITVLFAVAAEVDYGRTPTATERDRELARRYATDRLTQARFPTGVMAVIALLAVVDLGILLNMLLTGGPLFTYSASLTTFILIIYQQWILRPRYQRLLRKLGHPRPHQLFTP